MAYNYGGYQFQPQPYTGQQYNTAVNTQYTGAGPQYQTAVPMPQMPAQSYQQAPQQQQQTNSGFVWVQGEAGAKAYPVAAGNSVLLMDSENPVLYMKSTDATGRPLPMEVYDLVRRDTAPQIPRSQAAPVQQIDLSDYVKMSDLETKVTELVNKALGQ